MAKLTRREEDVLKLVHSKVGMNTYLIGSSWPFQR